MDRLLAQGLDLYGVGDVDKAVDAWRAALAQDPANAAAREYLEDAGADLGMGSDEAAVSTSLLDHLDTPLLVGDPEGRAAYANAAFERDFELTGGALRGRELASLFTGGGRERVLQAVARVCAEGQSLRFRLRESGRRYWVLASPIRRDGQDLGVILLLTDENPSDALA